MVEFMQNDKGIGHEAAIREVNSPLPLDITSQYLTMPLDRSYTERRFANAIMLREQPQSHLRPTAYDQTDYLRSKIV
jgi:hypothetical protein